LRYQWQFGGVDISAATNASLSLTSVQAANEGDYQVIASNIGASVTSSVATLTLNGPPRLSDVVRLPDGSVRFNLTGTPNRTYTIEASANLTNWLNVGTVVYTNGAMPFVDAGASALTNRFYRARQ
jgi:hypothetical protein